MEVLNHLESLNQLKEMDKGVRPLQNIFCLKWCMYYGIEVTWNILTGFPRETDEDYRQQAELLQSITHLQPPIGVGDIWLERFSPYFTRPDQYDVRITGPGTAYKYVYGADDIDMMKVAYDFEFETDNHIDPALVAALQQAVANWKARHQSENTPFLLFTKSVDFVTVYDGRGEGRSTKTRLEGASGHVLEFCNEAPRTVEQIRSHLAESGTPAEPEPILQDLEAQRFVYSENGRHLTLALPNNSNL